MNGQLTRKIIRFGVFEADLQQEELRRAGVRVRLQAQPFKVLALLLQRQGDVLTREEIIRELWGDETFVDFDQSVGAVMRRLRLALGDSATVPRYIETLRHKGYRFLLPVQTEEEEADRSPEVHPAAEPAVRPSLSRASIMGAVPALALVVALIVVSHEHEPAAPEPSRYDRVHAAVRPARENPATIRTAVAGAKPEQMKAYIAYQKGRYLWNMRTAAEVEKSIGYFRQAVRLDPEYAPGYAGLADAYVILNFYTGRNRRMLKEQAAAASRRALDLDDSIAGAHATQAYISFYYDWDWARAESGFQRAIRLDPRYATAHQWYAEYLFYMGRFEEAERHITRAHELDPQSLVIGLQTASPLMYSGNYVEAIPRIEEALKLKPGFPLGIYMLATCYEQLGRFDDAVAEYQKIVNTRMGLSGLGYVYGVSGRRDDARRVLQQLLNDSRVDGSSAFHIARVYAGLGEVAEAFRWLSKAREARDERMVMVKVEPKLEPLRSDPHFRDLLRELKLI